VKLYFRFRQLPFSILIGMLQTVALSTERNQVLLGIITALATKLFMVNLKLLSTAAHLASPSIPAQYFPTKLLV
jgi:hypothetical protein